MAEPDSPDVEFSLKNYLVGGAMVLSLFAGCNYLANKEKAEKLAAYEQTVDCSKGAEVETPQDILNSKGEEAIQLGKKAFGTDSSEKYIEKMVDIVKDNLKRPFCGLSGLEKRIYEFSNSDDVTKEKMKLIYGAAGKNLRQNYSASLRDKNLRVTTMEFPPSFIFDRDRLYRKYLMENKESQVSEFISGYFKFKEKDLMNLYVNQLKKQFIEKHSGKFGRIKATSKVVREELAEYDSSRTDISIQNNLYYQGDLVLSEVMHMDVAFDAKDESLFVKTEVEKIFEASDDVAVSIAKKESNLFFKGLFKKAGNFGKEIKEWTGLKEVDN